MAAKSTWRGAIDIAGLPVNVAVYPVVKSTTVDSLKLLTPDGKPVEQFYKDPTDPDGRLYKIGELGRGVKTEDGVVPLSDEALDMISDAERSTVIEASYFAPVESLPMELAVAAYSVVPDSKSAGSDRAVNIVWNGLRREGLAYVTQVTFRSGSKDHVMAIYATDSGLAAITFPFAEDLHGAQPVTVTPDDQAADMLAQVIKKKSEIRAFSLDDFQSQSRARRAEAIEAALAGREIQPREVPEAKTAEDFLSLLEAQLA